jgi:hypothetical protein
MLTRVGPGTSARETISGRPSIGEDQSNSERSIAHSVRTSTSAVTSPASLVRNVGAQANISERPQRVLEFVPGGWN